MSASDPRLIRRADEIRLVQDDEIGAEQLILEHFLERIIMLDRRIGRALARQFGRIVGEAAIGGGRAVDHGDDAVDSQS